MRCKYIDISNVSYKIKERYILNNINLTIEEGDSFALIGTNGAGKTTLLDIILNDLYPTTGQIIILGKKNYNFKDTGVLYDKMPNLPKLKVKEMIRLFSLMNNINYQIILKQYFTLFDIERINDSYISQLSQGERKRLGLLLAIIKKPKLLIMDEPFANLDPIMIEHLWSIIKSNQRTILFSTHNWAEVGNLANKIAFIHSGKIINQPQSAEKIINAMPEQYKICTEYSNNLNEILKEYNYYVYDNKVNIFFNKDKDSGLLEIINKISTNYFVRKVELMDAYLYISINQTKA